MKSNWIKLLSALACLTLTVGFASCGGNDDGGGDGAQECTHSFTEYVSNGDATCTEDGTKTAKCDNGCGETDTVVDKGSAGHNWDNGICTSCGEEKGYSKGLKYALNEDGESYSLVGIGDCQDTDLVIPSTYEDLPVTLIADHAFYFSRFLTSVEIPDSVTTIDSFAFSGCDSLMSITIPDSVTTMAGGAFYDCGILIIYCEAESEPSGWDSNWNYSSCSVVWDCNNNDVANDGYIYTVTDGIRYALKDGQATIVRQRRDVTIADIAKGLTYKGVEYSVSLIGEGAFYYCARLTEIVIPDSVTMIGEYAFYQCANLKSVDIGNGVTLIGEGAFYYCANLTSVVIGNSVTSIGEDVFSGCGSLTSIVVDENNTVYKSIDGNLYTKDGKTLLQYATGKSATNFTVPTGVTSIGNSAFFYCYSLTSIEIPDSVTTIGNSAFSYCRRLTSVVIPNSVTSIGDDAFDNCGSLTSVEFGNSVTTIGNSAFAGCGNLTSVVIGDNVTTIGECAFAGCGSLVEVIIPDSVTTIGDSAFSNCVCLTIYCEAESVPSGWDFWDGPCTVVWDCNNNDVANDGYIYTVVNGIRYGIKDGFATVVKQASNIITAEIAESIAYKGIEYNVTSISDYAFYRCNSLTNVVIGDGVTSISDYAFQDCNSLTNVIIGDGATYIGMYAFQDCNSLTNVEFGNSVTSIDYSAFDHCWSLTEIVIPDSVKVIGEDAFAYCNGLTKIIIPDSVIAIGDSAFLDCVCLTIYCEAESQPSHWEKYWNGSACPVVWDCNNNDVANDGYMYTVINGIRYGIKDGFATVVKQASNIITADIAKSITYKGIEYNVTTISDYAFSDCDNLTSVKIGDGVTTIGYSAFNGCYRLTEIVIPDGVTSISDYAFYRCNSLTSVVIGDGATYIGMYAFSDCDSLTEIVIPDSVIAMGSSAFYGCDSLTNITVDKNNAVLKDIDGNLYTKDGMILLQYAIGKTEATFSVPDGVTTIDDSAFSGCDSLKEIVIPDSVISIGSSAFEYCENLTIVKIGNGVTTIASYAFRNCYSLTEIVIPDSVTSIGEYAFNGCDHLTSVVIPDSVTSIGKYAFNGCYRLTSVYYKGTAEEWSAITIDSYGNTALTNATRYYYSESAPTTSGYYWHYNENGEIVVW